MEGSLVSIASSRTARALSETLGMGGERSKREGGGGRKEGREGRKEIDILYTKVEDKLELNIRNIVATKLWSDFSKAECKMLLEYNFIVSENSFRSKDHF